MAGAIGAAGGNIAVVEGFEAKGAAIERSVCINARSVEHQRQIIDAVDAVEGVDVLMWFDRTFRMHEGGKIKTDPLYPVRDRDDLSMALSLIHI